MWRIGQPASIFLAALCCALAAQAEAQEYCVACTGPNAVYRCVIDGAQPGGSQPLQMMCITTMAKEGGHATCGIKRGTVFDCDGPVKRIPWAALNAPAQPAPSQQSAVQPLPPSTAPAASPRPEPQEPPQTVLEMAKRANEKTAEQMKKSALAGNPPTRRSVFNDPELLAKFPAYPAQLRSLETSKPRPRTPLWNEIENVFGIFLSRANSGELAPEEAMNQANAEIAKIIERNQK